MRRIYAIIAILILLLCSCDSGRQTAEEPTVDDTYKQVKDPRLRVVNVYINDNLIALTPDARFNDEGATIFPVAQLSILNLQYDLKYRGVTISTMDGTRSVDIPELYYIDNSVYVPMRGIIDEFCDDFVWNADARSGYLYVYSMLATFPVTPSLLPDIQRDDDSITAYLNTVSKVLHVNADCSACKHISEAHRETIEVGNIDELNDLGYKVCPQCTEVYWQVVGSGQQ